MNDSTSHGTFGATRATGMVTHSTVSPRHGKPTGRLRSCPSTHDGFALLDPLIAIVPDASGTRPAKRGLPVRKTSTLLPESRQM